MKRLVARLGCICDALSPVALRGPGEQANYADRPLRALRGARGDRPLIATKGGHRRDGDTFPVDGRPATLRAHCETSLRTLEVERIDLYQLHHVDPRCRWPTA